MSASAWIGKIRRLADDNSPVILTGMAAAGACLTAYFTYKGAMKSAGQILQEVVATDPTANTEKGLSKTDIVVLTWKNYLPAAAALGGTITCQILATKIGLDRTAAMAGALVVTERTYDQYKEKVKETLGEAKHTKVVDAVATDRVNTTPNPNSMVLLDEGEQWCFDSWSGRYFKSRMEKLETAVNKINDQMIRHDYASLTDYYDHIGLDPIQESDNIGWSNDHLLAPKYTSALHENKPCIVISFDPLPNARFQNKHG